MSHFPIHNGSNQYPKTHSCIGQQEDSEGCGCGCLPPQIGLLSIQAMQQNFDTLAKHVQQIDAAMTNKLAHDEGMSQQLAILVSIPGIATTTALAMLVEMPELGTLAGKQAASLAGLAPSRVNQANGKARNTSEADGRCCGEPSTCPRSSRSASILSSRQNTISSSKLENLPRSPSPQSCASSSSWQTPYCVTGASGRKLALDEDGYSYRLVQKKPVRSTCHLAHLPSDEWLRGASILHCRRTDMSQSILAAEFPISHIHGFSN